MRVWFAVGTPDLPLPLPCFFFPVPHHPAPQDRRAELDARFKANAAERQANKDRRRAEAAALNDPAESSAAFWTSFNAEVTGRSREVPVPSMLGGRMVLVARSGGGLC